MAGYYDEITGEYVTTDDSGEEISRGPQNTGPLDNTSGTQSMTGWSYLNGVWTDPTGTPYDLRYLTENEQLTIGNQLSKLGSSVAKQLVGAFTKADGSTDWKKVAAAAGGLYGLYQSTRPQEKTGYQGKIPKYEAIRESVEGSQYDPTRRPGSGGQRYFSDISYAAPDSEAATTKRAAAKEQAAGLAAINRANPARDERSPTATAVERGRASEEVREPPRAASSVITDKPVPKYADGGITALAQGRYLDGATDGMADKIPARIDGKQEARLSHGEFVIPADVVGHLGNGNSEAGAKRLYDMMERIRKARTGTAKQGKQINPNKFLPA